MNLIKKGVTKMYDKSSFLSAYALDGLDDVNEDEVDINEILDSDEPIFADDIDDRYQGSAEWRCLCDLPHELVYGLGEDEERLVNDGDPLQRRDLRVDQVSIATDVDLAVLHGTPDMPCSCGQYTLEGTPEEELAEKEQFDAEYGTIVVLGDYTDRLAAPVPSEGIYTRFGEDDAAARCSCRKPTQKFVR